MIFATIPASILYAVPIAVVFTIVGVLHYAAQKTVNSASKKITSTAAEDALVAFMNANNMGDVRVVASADYTYNDYNLDSNSIELSPDVIGSVDVNSVALALRAGGRALAFRNEPERATRMKKLQRFGSLVFWLAFCVLSFGIMSSSLECSAAGYVVVVLVGLINLCEKNAQKKIDAQVESFVDSTNLFDAQTKVSIKKSLAATR